MEEQKEATIENREKYEQAHRNHQFSWDCPICNKRPSRMNYVNIAAWEAANFGIKENESNDNKEERGNHENL